MQKGSVFLTIKKGRNTLSEHSTHDLEMKYKELWQEDNPERSQLEQTIMELLRSRDSTLISHAEHLIRHHLTGEDVKPIFGPDIEEAVIFLLQTGEYYDANSLLFGYLKPEKVPAAISTLVEEAVLKLLSSDDLEQLEYAKSLIQKHLQAGSLSERVKAAFEPTILRLLESSDPDVLMKTTGLIYACYPDHPILPPGVVCGVTKAGLRLLRSEDPEQLTAVWHLLLDHFEEGKYPEEVLKEAIHQLSNKTSVDFHVVASIFCDHPRQENINLFMELITKYPNKSAQEYALKHAHKWRHFEGFDPIPVVTGLKQMIAEGISSEDKFDRQFTAMDAALLGGKYFGFGDEAWRVLAE